MSSSSFVNETVSRQFHVHRNFKHTQFSRKHCYWRDSNLQPLALQGSAVTYTSGSLRKNTFIDNIYLISSSICSGAKVHLESETGPEVTVMGLDKSGFLAVKDQDGSLRSVQPDGNSFDMTKNLVLMKQRWNWKSLVIYGEKVLLNLCETKAEWETWKICGIFLLDQ